MTSALKYYMIISVTGHEISCRPGVSSALCRRTRGALAGNEVYFPICSKITLFIAPHQKNPDHILREPGQQTTVFIVLIFSFT
jgi:hypothetical protein